MTTALTATAAPTLLQTATAVRRATGEPIRADDPEAIAKIDARIKRLEDARAAIKTINNAVRSRSTGSAKLREYGLTDAMIDDARRKGGMFEGWELQNLGQNIVRLKKRRAVIEREADRAPAEDVEGDGYRLVENTGLNRIQFLFDKKPDADLRTTLKRNGFRWSPSQDAWQRHLNENGRYAAKRIVQAMTKTWPPSPSPRVKPSLPPKGRGGFRRCAPDGGAWREKDRSDEIPHPRHAHRPPEERPREDRISRRLDRSSGRQHQGARPFAEPRRAAAR